MHTIVHLMKKHRLAWLALTETHMKQQDQFIVDGYTFSHGASEELDEHGKPKQTFTGVTLVTAPYLAPAIIDLTVFDGRLISFVVDTAAAPLTVFAVYAPHNGREQDVRDDFWAKLTEAIHSRKRNQPFRIVGDFNAQLVDELASASGAVGPRFHWEKTSEEEMAMQDKGEGESNHVRFFELIFQEDLCVPQTWMQKKHKHRFTHARPAGEEVQLDHVIPPIQWRNIITDVCTVSGAALNSNRYLVKLSVTLRTKRERREAKAQENKTPHRGGKRELQQTTCQQVQHLTAWVARRHGLHAPLHGKHTTHSVSTHTGRH